MAKPFVFVAGCRPLLNGGVLVPREALGLPGGEPPTVRQAMGERES